jgi:hypothetical protein
MPEPELSQGRPQRRRGIRPWNNCPIPPCRSNRVSSMQPASATIPATQRGHFQPRMRSPITWKGQTLISQPTQPGPLSQRQRRGQPSRRHQTRFVKRRRRGR